MKLSTVDHHLLEGCTHAREIVSFWSNDGSTERQQFTVVHKEMVVHLFICSSVHLAVPQIFRG